MDKTPLQFYESIQALVQKDARDVATNVYNELGTQYDVPSVPVHQHDGSDALAIPFENLDNASLYRVVRYVTLTSAQIKALFSTPVSLVSAIGTSSLIVVEHITARVNFPTVGGTAYTGANALEFRYTNGVGIKVTADMPNTFINSAGSAYYHAPAVTAAFVPVANAAVVVAVPTANPATGNSSITFCVVYRVIPFNT